MPLPSTSTTTTGRNGPSFCARSAGTLPGGKTIPEGKDQVLLSLLPSCPVSLETEERGDHLQMLQRQLRVPHDTWEQAQREGKDTGKERSSQFKLSYQYREYHYQPHELTHPRPEQPVLDLARDPQRPQYPRSRPRLLCLLCLVPGRPPLVLRSVFGIPLSYQTVLNYAAAAAFYCHSFNLAHKGSIDEISAGDEAYIKVMGKQHYVFFFISSKNLKITAYHVADSRETLPAIIAMNEAIRTADAEQTIILVTDGNPSYPAGIHFLNAQRAEDPYPPEGDRAPEPRQRVGSVPTLQATHRTAEPDLQAPCKAVAWV